MNHFAIDVQHLTVSYSKNPVLWDVEVKIPRGILMALVGPNGAGKSTFIKSIIGLVKPIAGRVFIFGKTYKKMQKRIAYVPQRMSVDWDFPITVFDVVLMGRYGFLGWIKRPRPIDKEKCLNALQTVGLFNYKDEPIGKLSGGQQQRVFLARALVQEADIYLMDEPLAGVDAATEKSVITLLRELKKKGKTVVCVTTGGNFDFERLPEVKERALRSSGLKKYFILRMPQRPGSLKDFLGRLGPDDDIARFEYLKKSARNFGSVLIGIETKDPRAFDALFARLEEGGFEYRDITDDRVLAEFLI